MARAIRVPQLGLWFKLFITVFSAALFLFVIHDDHSASANGYSKVVLGGFSTCALTIGTSDVECWGQNEFAQLGDGSGGQIGDKRGPVLSVGGASDVTAGYYHGCAVVSGIAKCWGENDDGQLGNPNANDPTPCNTGAEGNVACSRTAKNVCNYANCSQGLPQVLAVSAGFKHTCALITGGSVACWGANDYGQLGNNSTTDSSTPVAVSGLSSGVVAIAAGGAFQGSHTCALMSTATVKCWGGNSFGQLGRPTTQLCGGVSCSTVPVDVCDVGTCSVNLSNIVEIDSGGHHSCALTNTGEARCWGDNSHGEIGNNSTANATTPVPVCVDTNCTHLDAVTHISTPGLSSCALRSTGGGTLKCWGFNSYGQLGNGAFTANVLLPVDVCATPGTCSYPTNVLTGVAGLLHGPTAYHNCALMSSPASPKCWGANNVRQVGADTVNSCVVHIPCSWTPVDVLAQTSASDWDGDGCTNAKENGSVAAQGGQRNPKYYWDFADMPDSSNQRNKVITVADISAVVQRVGATDSGPGTFNRYSDPLSAPPPPGSGRANYHPAFDRGGTVGPNAWDVRPADGVIDNTDIAIVQAQYGHNCN